MEPTPTVLSTFIFSHPSALRSSLLNKGKNLAFRFLVGRRRTLLSLPVMSDLCDPMDCSPPGSSVHGIFFRHEYWCGLSFPPPGDLPDPGIKPMSPMSPAGGFITGWATREAQERKIRYFISFLSFLCWPSSLLGQHHTPCALRSGLTTWGFLGGASGKEPTCQCRRCKRHRFNPWVRKIPWRRAWQAIPVFLPGESHGQRSLVGYSPWGHKE